MDQISHSLVAHPRGDIDVATLGASAPVLLNVWVYFNLISNDVLLPILLLTILISNQLERHATFINVCVTWILSGIFSLLLFYTHQYGVQEPPKGLCIAQASLLFGTPPMWVATAFAFFYYVYRSIQGQSHQSELGIVTSRIMFVGPYFCQITFSVAALAMALSRPDLVLRQGSFFYCGLHSRPLILARTVFVTFGAGCVSMIQLLLLYKSYCNYSGIRRLSTPEANTQLRSIRRCAMRVSALGVYVAFGAILELVTIARPKSLLPQIYISTVGTVVFLVFGTQQDVLRVWFPCLSRKEPEKTSSTVLSPRDSDLRSHFGNFDYPQGSNRIHDPS